MLFACKYSDVSLDKEFCKLIPNQRPETCPRRVVNDATRGVNTTNVDDDRRGRVLGFRRGMSILLVGDGDFSFSLGLARRLLLHKTALAKGTTNRDTCILATSYESASTLRNCYPNFDQTIHELEDLGVIVAFNVDATNLSSTISATVTLQHKFHRICWNFPCTNIEKGQDGQNKEMEANKTLIRKFVNSAQTILTDRGDGELYICHKTKPPFNQWNLEEVALQDVQHSQQQQQQQRQQHTWGSSIIRTKKEMNAKSALPLFYTGRIVLDRFLIPPYTPRKALDRKSFPNHDACFFIFSQTEVYRRNEKHQKQKQTLNIIKPTNPIRENIFPSTISCNFFSSAPQLCDSEVGNSSNRDHDAVIDSTTLIKINPDLIQRIRRRHIDGLVKKRMTTTSSIIERKGKKKKTKLKACPKIRSCPQ